MTMHGEHDRSETASGASFKTRQGVFLRLASAGGILLIIAAGIYAQVPVLTLAAAVSLPALLAFVPKSLRIPAFCLMGVLFVGLLTIFLLPGEKDADWRPYGFDAEVSAWLAKQPPVPDSQNAALLYQDVIKQRDWSELRNELWEHDPNGITEERPWSAEEFPEIADVVEDVRGELERLAEAARPEQYRPLPDSDPFAASESWANLSQFRGLSALLSRLIYYDDARGQTGDAVDMTLTMLRMGRHLNVQPSQYHLLVGMAIEGMAYRVLNPFLVEADLNDETLGRIERELAAPGFVWADHWPRVMEFEKLRLKNTFGEILYEVNSKGRMRVSMHAITNLYRHMFEDEYREEFLPPAFARVLGNQANWLFAPRRPKTIADYIDRQYEPFFEMALADYDWNREPEDFKLSALKPSYEAFVQFTLFGNESMYRRSHTLYLRMRSDRQACLLLIALRRYRQTEGRWPAALDELDGSATEPLRIDPINGLPYVYRLTDEGFMFYSIGPNGVDDNGRHNYRIDEDDILFWPPDTGF